MSLTSRDHRLLAGPNVLPGTYRGTTGKASDLTCTFGYGTLQTVGEVMSQARSVSPDLTICELAQLMQRCESPCLIVVERERPVGIVTRRDMIKILALTVDEPTLWTSPIRKHMSRPVHALRVHATCNDAQRVFDSRGFNSIPVVSAQGRLVGLLSRERLAEAQREALEIERNAIRRQVYTRSRELQKANRQLQALALEDSLLKIGNRRALEIDAQFMHMNAVRHQHPYSLALLDVDFFKRYNDHYGHCAGDHALVAIVDCLKESLRRGDRLYRYGGEELLLMMPETSHLEAMEAVWRVVKNLYQLNMEHGSSPYGRLTISGGVSTYDTGSGLAWADILEQADHHLYRAKAMGRNCVYGAADENSRPKTQHS